MHSADQRFNYRLGISSLAGQTPRIGFVPALFARMFGLRPRPHRYWCVTLLLVGLTGRVPGAEETKTVILLKPAVPERRALTDFTIAFYDELTKRWPGKVSFFTEDVTPRLGPYEERYPWLRQKYHDHKVDLVVCFGDVYVSVAFDHRALLWPDSPVLLTGVSTARHRQSEHRRNATALTLDQDVNGTLEMAHRFFPGAPALAFVSGAKPTDAGEQERWIKEVEAAATGTMRFKNLVGLNRPQTLERARDLPTGTIVLYREMSGSGARNPPAMIKFMNDLSRIAPGPLLTLADDPFEHDALCAVSVDYSRLGKETAMKALAIFKSGNATQVPVTASKAFSTVFDWRQLQRWGLDEKLVPPGSEFRFRTPGLWEAHRWTMIVVSVALAAQAALITVLVSQASRRRRAKQELDEQLQFERLTGEISSEFINLPVDQFRGRIEHSLARVADFLGFDAAAIVVFFDGATRAEVRHLWRRITSPEVKEMMTDRQFPWTFAEQVAGRDISFEDPAELPPQAETDRRSYEWLGLRTLSNVTLSAGGTVVGAFPIASQDRRVTVTPLMRRRQALIGEIFANAILRERSENELRASQERLSLATAAARLGVWSWNVSTGVIEATAECKQMFGWSPEVPVNFTMFRERLHPDDRATVQRAMDEALGNRTVYDAQYRVVLPDGQIRWIAARGRAYYHNDAPANVLGMVLDITERKRAEEKFRLAVEASPSGIVLVDEAGRIVLVNSLTEKLFGYAREELIGQPVELLVPERLRGAHPAHRAEFLRAPRARVMGAGRELFARRKDGTEFPVEIGLSPIQSEAGVLVLTVIVDITERKRADAEAQRQRAELAHVARVSTMGELAASVAHELNQPLGAILSNAEAAEMFLNQDPPALQDVREILADIRKDDERAGEVIRRMRALLRKREMEMHSLDLNSVVEDVFRMVSGDAALRKITLAADLSPRLPAVRGDRVHLQQVLLNLTMNAMEAMGRHAPEKRRLTVRTSINGEGILEVAVADSGIGIEPDKLPRVFEPFFTTKPNGMGMGLSIARTIIEAHRGQISAENNSSGGATFRVTLPVAAA